MPLYAFGSNSSGQLGVGHKVDLPKPQPCRLTQNRTSLGIKQVVAGGNHTLILHENGLVEAFGTNEHHELGIPHASAQSNPAGSLSDSIQIGLVANRVTQIAANWTTSTCLDSSGGLATCGEGLSGELGRGEGISMSATPDQIERLKQLPGKAAQIASSMAHTVVVLDSGDVLGWGKGRKGQLGSPLEDAWAPRKIEVAFPVVKAVCGKDFTFVAGDPEEGKVALIGAEGKDRFNLKSSMPDNARGWRDIAASWGSIYILFDDGRVVGYGRDDHGQLCPPGLPAIEQVAAGSEHCIALTKDGKVLAWGWGEHGNCGERTDKNGDVKGRWNEIKVDGRPIGVFAGCATSFIVTKT